LFRKLLGSKKEQGTGLRRRLENGEVHYLYSASNIVGLRNSRKLPAA
jgi:hypothetical protein